MREGDTLNNVIPTTGNDTMFIGTHLGYSVTFKEGDVRVMGRTATGVRGVRLRTGDYVVGSDILHDTDESSSFPKRDTASGPRPASTQSRVAAARGSRLPILPRRMARWLA